MIALFGTLLRCDLRDSLAVSFNTAQSVSRSRLVSHQNNSNHVEFIEEKY